MTQIRFLLVILLLIITMTFQLGAQQSDEPLALGGIDVLSYFEDGEPSYGVSDYSVVVNNKRWLFQSEERAIEFERSPDSYMPGFEGYGAWGVARGNLLQPNFNYWKIEQGQLLLFHSHGTLRRWNKTPGSMMLKAMQNWPELKQQLSARYGK